MGLDKDDRRLWQTALRAVRPFPLTSSKIKLVVGVSGGADSLALLHLLWQQLSAARLIVAHLNHGLRPEADADAQFVFETAAAWQIPFVSQKVDVAQVAQAEGVSLEAAGRQIRYQFFAKQAVQFAADAVAADRNVALNSTMRIFLHILVTPSTSPEGMAIANRLIGKSLVTG